MKVIEKKCNNIGAIIARVNSSGPKVIVPSSSLFSVLFKGNITNPSLFRYHFLGNHLFQWSRLVSLSVNGISARNVSADGHWC